MQAVSKVSEQDGHVKDALEKQIEQHREQHQKQVRLIDSFLFATWRFFTSFAPFYLARGCVNLASLVS